jgi:protein-S-isoprenylcysteine O-methyltransferase Ste14
MQRFHHWSDWAGFIAFTLIWVSIVKAAPAIGLMTAPMVLHPFLSSVGFLLRKPLVSSVPGVWPRIAGYAGTFSISLCIAVFQRLRPQWVALATGVHVRMAGTVIWLIGAGMGVWAVWSLRHGMSIIPQARTVITDGAYRYARHPLYAAYIVQNIGLWLRMPTVAIALVLVGWFVITLVRVRYEEGVLAENFPEYGEYRYAVGMFSPYLRLRPAPALSFSNRAPARVRQSPSRVA